jgi:hypothetical protein
MPETPWRYARSPTQLFALGGLDRLRCQGRRADRLYHCFRWLHMPLVRASTPTAAALINSLAASTVKRHHNAASWNSALSRRIARLTASTPVLRQSMAPHHRNAHRQPHHASSSSPHTPAAAAGHAAVCPAPADSPASAAAGATGSLPAVCCEPCWSISGRAGAAACQAPARTSAPSARGCSWPAKARVEMFTRQHDSSPVGHVPCCTLIPATGEAQEV